MGFWAEGFWSDPFWAAGFWQTDAALPASLGAWGGRSIKPLRPDEDNEIQEAIPDDAVSRLRDEMLGAALETDIFRRARVRRLRADEEALILML